MGKMSDLDIRLEEEADTARMCVGKDRMIDSIAKSVWIICDEFNLDDDGAEWIEEALWNKAFNL